MNQTKTDILLSEIQLEINPTTLSKCGEIKIDDCCTNAYIFCAFCRDDELDGDTEPKFFTTLAEFIGHIRWHRSDDHIFENGLEDDYGSNSAEHPIQEDEFLTDWIAPPEELFESNTMTNFIEMEPHLHEVQLVDGKPEETDENTTWTKQTNTDEEELTGEVFIELLDLYKKCPCVWHEHIASTTNSDIIEGVYKLLHAHFNKHAQKSKPVDYVIGILLQIKNCFLDEYKKNLKQNTETESLPWYFPYLSFLLNCDSVELDMNIFTDFVCSICTLELNSQDELWNHILKVHIQHEQSELSKEPKAPDSREDEVDNRQQSNNKSSLCEYPEEVLDKFIDLYRSQTRLWDKTNKEYYSRLLRRKSYYLLLNILREHNPKSTHADVVHRINYLHKEFACGKKGVLGFENCNGMPANDLALRMKNITLKKNRDRPPQLKVRPGKFKKIIKNGKCPICSMSFKDHSKWLSHMESAHTSSDYESIDGFFYCTICGWQNKTKKLLMRHLRNKHTNNLQRCTDCNLKFRLLSMLVEHRAKAHNDFNPFKCETCGDGFPNRSGLRAHTISHTNAEECASSCAHCGIKFADKKSFEAHIRQHIRDKKDLLCKFCNKKWTTLSELRNHMRTHLSLFSNKCDICGRGFKSPQILKKHLNEIHNGTNFSIYKNMLKKQTPSSKICRQTKYVTSSCDDCGAKFFRKASLYKHKRLKHNGNVCAS